MAFDLFKASVPGQSLTQEVGGAPFEHPPQFTDVNDALEYLFDKFSNKRQTTRLVLMLRKRVPVEFIARTILYNGFIKNKWTPDVALLMGRILMAMIISIGTVAGVKNIRIFNPDKSQEQFLDQFLDDVPEEMPNSEAAAPEDVTSQFTGLLGAQM